MDDRAGNIASRSLSALQAEFEDLRQHPAVLIAYGHRSREVIQPDPLLQLAHQLARVDVLLGEKQESFRDDSHYDD